MFSIAIPTNKDDTNVLSFVQIRRMMSDYERIGWEMEEEIQKGVINFCRYQEIENRLVMYHRMNFNGLSNLPLFMEKLMGRNMELYDKCSKIMKQILYQYLNTLNLPLNENHCPECRGEDLNNEESESEDESATFEW